MKNDSPLNLESRPTQGGDWKILHEGDEISQEDLQEIVSETVEVYFAEGDREDEIGWCYKTFTVRDRKGLPPEVLENDGGPIGPSLREVGGDREDLPSAEEAGDLAAERWDRVWVDRDPTWSTDVVPHARV